MGGPPGGGEGETVPTATSSTSPLSARELVEISLLEPELSVPSSGSVLSSYPLLISSSERNHSNTSRTSLQLTLERKKNSN